MKMNSLTGWYCPWSMGLPLKNQVISETGSEVTVHTILTFLPLGTVRYMEVGDNSGSHANSVRLKKNVLTLVTV